MSNESTSETNTAQIHWVFEITVLICVQANLNIIKVNGLNKIKTSIKTIRPLFVTNILANLEVISLGFFWNVKTRLHCFFIQVKRANQWNGLQSEMSWNSYNSQEKANNHLTILEYILEDKFELNSNS